MPGRAAPPAPPPETSPATGASDRLRAGGAVAASVPASERFRSGSAGAARESPVRACVRSRGFVPFAPAAAHPISVDFRSPAVSLRGANSEKPDCSASSDRALPDSYRADSPPILAEGQRDHVLPVVGQPFPASVVAPLPVRPAVVSTAHRSEPRQAEPEAPREARDRFRGRCCDTSPSYLRQSFELGSVGCAWSGWGSEVVVDSESASNFVSTS